MSKSNVLYLDAPDATSSPPKTRVTVTNARPRPRRWSALLLGFLVAAFMILLGALLGWGTANAQPADDAAPSVVDAAPAVIDAPAEAGSGAGTTEPAPHTTIDNPITNPIAAWDDAKAARKLGWSAVLYFALYLFALLAGTLGQRREIKWLAWIGKGRAAVVVAGVGTVGAAGFDAIVLGGSPLAAALAALVAGMHFLRGELMPAKG